jgi:ADP-ribose pyrophosphatase YjhB (NUDIX family)
MSNSNEAFTLTTEEAASLRRGFRYCPRCRTELVNRDVYGRIRRVCPAESCRFVQFIDPKVGAAVFALSPDNRVLLVKRSMDPAKGSWCLPGGFMELNETPQETAARECKEESGFDVTITGLIDVFYYEDYRGSGVLIVYKGHITGGTPQTGDDSDEVGLFAADSVPDPIVFDSNIKVLAAWRDGNI